MTDEIKNVETETCLCKNKTFRKILVIATGTFVGVFCALSLFAALHKPPMMHPAAFGGPMVRPCPCHCQSHFYRHGDFERGPRGDFHKKYQNVKFDKNVNKPVQKETIE